MRNAPPLGSFDKLRMTDLEADFARWGVMGIGMFLFSLNAGLRRGSFRMTGSGVVLAGWGVVRIGGWAVGRR